MGRVIYINGPSSSGKSTLIRVLQNKLDDVYLRIGIDPVIGMMPPRLNDWRSGIVRTDENVLPGFCWNFSQQFDNVPVHNLVCGPEGKRVVDLLHVLARTMLLSGYSIIIDDVALGGSQDVARWRDTLKDFSVLWVGLTAPLHVLEKRERDRGDRAIGSSRVQVDLVHQGEIHYDLFFDTEHMSIEQIVQEVVSKMEG